MDKFVKVSDVIDWFRAYGHMDQQIPFETLVTDLRENCVPAADVAPVVHGQWLIRFDASKQEIDGFQCSVCGKREKEKEPYCHCGAKMDGDESHG